MTAYGFSFGNVTGAIVRDHLSDDNYVNTFMGRILAYSINDHTLAGLVDITNRVYSAFNAANSESSLRAT